MLRRWANWARSVGVGNGFLLNSCSRIASSTGVVRRRLRGTREDKLGTKSDASVSTGRRGRRADACMNVVESSNAIGWNG